VEWYKGVKGAAGQWTHTNTNQNVVSFELVQLGYFVEEALKCRKLETSINLQQESRGEQNAGGTVAHCRLDMREMSRGGGTRRSAHTHTHTHTATIPSTATAAVKLQTVSNTSPDPNGTLGYSKPAQCVSALSEIQWDRIPQHNRLNGERMSQYRETMG
jgi:hypothetical protein